MNEQERQANRRKVNFKAIDASDIWQEHMKPFLEELLQDALEEKANPRLPIQMPVEGATLEAYHFWRGAVHALKMVIDAPAMQMEIDRMEAAQEKRDEAIRTQQSSHRRTRP